MCDEIVGRGDGLAQPQQSMADFEKAYPGLSESMVDVPTADGTCDAFFVHPSEGKHPGVILWPDAFGLREANKAMARRLASSGYAVLVVNSYYRAARTPLGISHSDFANEDGRNRIMALMKALTPEVLARDTKAFVAFLDAQGAVDTSRGIGTQGYCMGGSQAFRAAAAVPERIKAVASFHGGGLATEAPDSPHRTLAKTQASYLILPGLDDDERAPAEKDILRQTAEETGRPAEIEVYQAKHGWCVPDVPMYDKGEADRAWDRLLALYAGL